jgi:hypothetical protein
VASVEERVSRGLAARAGAVAAPPDAHARRAVARRVVWRRRRRRRLTAGALGTAIVVAAVAVVAGLTGSDEGATPVRTGPDAGTEPPPTPEAIPALTVEGYAVVEGESSLNDPPPGVTREPVDPVNGEALADRLSVQAFRRPGDFAGPGAVVTHGRGAASLPEGGSRGQVRLPGGVLADLVELPGGGARAVWRAADGSGFVSVQAWGLASGDLVAFVEGLVPRPGRPGVDATVLPAGIEEDPVDPPADPSQMWVGYRVLDLEPEGEAAGDGLGPAHVTVMRSDEADFEITLGARASGGGAVEQVTVLGRPAALVHPRGPTGWWTLLWRHDAADRVEVRIAGPDRTGVDRVIGALREVDAGAFDELLDEAGGRAPEDTPPSTTLAPRD